MKNRLLLGAMLYVACTFSMQVNAQLEVQTNGDVQIGENLQVTENVTCGNQLQVTGNTTCGNQLQVAGNVTCGNKLQVTGNVTCMNKLQVTGNVTCGNDLQVSNNITCGNDLQVSKYLYVDRSATITKNLNVERNVQVGKNVAIQTDIDSTIALNVAKIVPVPNQNYSTPHIGIKSHVSTTIATPTLPSYAIYGKVDALDPNSFTTGREMVGVCGYACKPYQASSTFAAGVAGLSHYYGGIGVFGAIGAGNVPTSMSSGTYAGYFNGTVKVNGTLMATTISTTSDERTKENIQKLTSSQADLLKSLRPVSYTIKQDSAWVYDKEATELQGVHYGLIAQDVQKVLPEVVYERADQLSINYIELIPLLILKIQELSAEVEVLKSKHTK